MNIGAGKHSRWLGIILGPVLSLIAFVITYYLDPLSFGEQAVLSALPAFLLSVLILLVNHQVMTSLEVQKTSEYSDRIFEAIKNYMHVTPVGSPEKAMEYVNARMGSLKEVKNTSFNIEGRQERAEDKFYDTATYKDTIKNISYQLSKGLIWKDIGDQLAVNRFRDVKKSSSAMPNGTSSKYRYRLIAHQDAQMNFILLEYKDGSSEVLFNWDMRGMGQDPIVLLSREPQLINMYSVQFEYLWRGGSEDHDNSA